MRLKKILIYGLLCLPFYSQAVKVGGMVEPVVGFGFLGSLKSSYESDQATKKNTTYESPFTFSTLGVGLKLFLTLDKNFFIGPDFNYAPISFVSPSDGTKKSYNPGNLGTLDATGSLLQVGLTTGYAFSEIPLRFYTGFNFVNTASVKYTVKMTGASDQITQQWAKGVAWKLGLSYNIIQLLAANLEYSYMSFQPSATARLNYDGLSSNGTVFAANTDQIATQNYDYSHFVTISLSVPFSF